MGVADRKYTVNDEGDMYVYDSQYNHFRRNKRERIYGGNPPPLVRFSGCQWEWPWWEWPDEGDDIEPKEMNFLRQEKKFKNQEDKRGEVKWDTISMPTD